MESQVASVAKTRYYQIRNIGQIACYPKPIIMMKLKSYNCRGLRKAELADIIVKCDVLLLQQTWLAKQELELLNDLHEDYSGFGTAKCDYANGIIIPAESLGVLLYSWKTSLDSNICGIDLKYDWCIGIRIQSGDSATVVINVYLPYEC